MPSHDNWDFVVWNSTPDIIKLRTGEKELGDIPVFRINPVTNSPEEVVNNRGRAYGLRRALKYRKRKK